jgi:hypothetical protein
MEILLKKSVSENQATPSCSEMKKTNRLNGTLEKLGVVTQVKMGMQKRNRLAMVAGAVMGGFVPIATYVVGHYETGVVPAMWLVVAGGLAYSAKSVYDFAAAAFRHPAKALGFVLLVEGVMTFSQTPALALSALALLVAINAISAGVNLSLESRL